MKKGKIAGDDQNQRKEDAKGYKTSVDMLTGGSSKDLEGMTGPEVCAPYGESLVSGKK